MLNDSEKELLKQIHLETVIWNFDNTELAYLLEENGLLYYPIGKDFSQNPVLTEKAKYLIGLVEQ